MRMCRGFGGRALMCWLVILGIALTAGCAPAAATGGGSGSSAEARPSRALVMLVRYEPTTLASVELRPAGAGTSSTRRLFNAGLDMTDGSGKDHPYLAEALPELNTSSWQVFPDGRMQTSYRLKPDLRWQDGAPLTAGDFVFSWRLFSTPDLGVATSKPFTDMEEVTAPDTQTVVIRWRQPFAEARALGMGFPPIPRHILEQPLREMDPEAFIQQPFWTTQFVGVGPYRIDRWELGAFLEGAAFDGHVLGRPKINRVTVRFIADENTALTNLLAGEADYATGRSLRVEHAAVLKQRWAPGEGSVILTPDSARYSQFQFRPELVNPKPMLDLNVRRALAHSIDKQAFNDGIFGGEPVARETDTFLFRYFRTYYIPDIDRALTEVEKVVSTYPYDPRRSEQIMSQGGYLRGRDGVWMSAAGERVAFEARSDQGVQYERELAILAEGWQRAGFEVSQWILPAAQLRDGEVRSTFPALSSTSGGSLANFGGSAIPTPANRWIGSNRGGWANPEYDRVVGALTTTLDGSERIRQIAEMSRIISEQLPGWVLYSNPSVSAYYPALKGPDNSANNSDVWNIHQWEIR